MSFTGGLVTGRRVMAAAAGTVKKVALELGGKNPNIVFADADLDAALDNALTAVFLHSGQVCSAGARLIVEESIHDAFVDALVERAGQIRLGGPFDEARRDRDADLRRAPGRRCSATSTTRSRRARCCAAAARRPTIPALAGGHYFLPTVLDGCVSAMGCVQDESFGPVLTVETFRTEDEAVRIANDTMYGLAGAVWSSDASRVQRVAGGLRHGTVWINDYHPYLPQAEWGGFKQSGVGRELGPAGLHEYLEAKHIYQNLNPAPSGWFAGAPSSEGTA